MQQSGARGDVEGGGGVMCDSSECIFNNSVIQSNTAKYGAGVYQSQGHLAITKQSRVIHNTAEYGPGGVILNQATGHITDTFVGMNVAGIFGGGIRIAGNSNGAGTVYLTRVTLQGNIVTRHSTTSGGAGLYAMWNAIVISRQSLFINNYASNNQGHQIMTYKRTDGTPSITLINTKFVQQGN